MKFKLTGRWIKFDVYAYNKAIETHLTKAVKTSGRIWIRAATDRIPIPTWSGASRATFQKLARLVDTSVPVGAQRSRKNRENLGRAVSQGSKLDFRPANQYFGFVYSSSLRYLTYNEYNKAVVTIPGSPPAPMWKDIANTPYGFQARALKAWRVYAKQVKLPSPMRAKYLKRIKVG